MQDFPVIKRNGFFKGNDFPWLCSRLFGSQVEEGRQFGGACFIDWPLGSLPGAFSTSASLIFKQFHLNNHFPLQTWLTY
jgi:hypothetical protein